MIEEFAARMLAARDVAHREHWRTGSDAAHRALGDFYDSLIEAVDQLVECYQGQFGLIGDFTVQTKKVDNIVEYLRDDVDWIQSVQDVISQGDRAIENLVDGIVSIYLKTLFRLENLK